MQIFTLGNPVRFGLKWFAKEENSLAVYEATVPNNRENFNYKYSGQYLQIEVKFIFSREVINWRRDENRIDWKVHLNLQLFTCATYNNLHKATRLLLLRDERH